MIVDIIPSPVKHKRFRAYIIRRNGRTEYYDFGLDGAKTYIDGRTEQERANYIARHLGNKTEEQLITNLVPSPSVLSRYLLWGRSRDLQANVKYLNEMWKRNAK
jgi:hypothetical protein